MGTPGQQKPHGQPPPLPCRGSIFSHLRLLPLQEIGQLCAANPPARPRENQASGSEINGSGKTVSRQAQTSLIPLNELKMHCPSLPGVPAAVAGRAASTSTLSPPPRPAKILSPGSPATPRMGTPGGGDTAGCQLRSFQGKEAAGADLLVLFHNLFGKAKDK